MTYEGYLGAEYLTPVTPWMDCVKCWEKALEGDGDKQGQNGGWESRLIPDSRRAITKVEIKWML